jgi:hypothetical protein
MLISSNELTSLLKRVFEGMGYPFGAYEEAASLVRWLEAHGEQGLAELARALPYLADRQRPALELVVEDEQVLLFDCHGRSGLNCLPSVLELARAKVLAAGFVSVQLRNCHNRKFVLKLLVDCARQGISVLARWRNGRLPAREHLACIAAGTPYPHYSEGVLPEVLSAGAEQAMSLVLSIGVDLHARLRGTPEHQAGPEHYALARSGSLECGMEIHEDLWRQLNELAEAVLVESSEHSRAGAGGR